MYHIRNDRRTLRSAHALYEGLMACLGHRPFDQVTISDVQHESGVARTTFYRSFDNLSDLLAWRCDECFREALGSLGPDAFWDERRMLRRYFSYWMEHGDILELLVKINRYDIVYASHRRVAGELRDRFGAIPGVDPAHGDYFIAVRTGFTLSVLTTWVEHGRAESIDDLIQIIGKLGLV
ncbi:MAG: TetR/AcrR family transcriptional regulator [Olsenella sp.]|jgi:AcrR family transcriptional regulator|nr:TetR/AcrR family transcriptional regulator [Olsenella sp.]